MLGLAQATAPIPAVSAQAVGLEVTVTAMAGVAQSHTRRIIANFLYFFIKVVMPEFKSLIALHG